MKRIILIIALFGLVSRTAVAQVVMETVTVGNPGNTGELSGEGADGFGPDCICGAVDYVYNIGKYEVTYSQYAEFLNAIAEYDTYELYNIGMGGAIDGGIIKCRSTGGLSYSAKPNMGDKPVNYIKLRDAMRFVNWLHNGQPVGEQDEKTTEDGVYKMSEGETVTRAADAQIFVPSENEWYKAAYHQPAGEGGDSDDYWLYPTASNDIPTLATADPHTGDISNPGANVANYAKGAEWNGQRGNLTTVGSADPLSESFYGTSDQGGNVYEWTDTLLSPTNRFRRGGSIGGSEFGLRSSTTSKWDGIGWFGNFIGFRVASAALRCDKLDSDGDGDIDIEDYAALQRCFTGKTE